MLIKWNKFINNSADFGSGLNLEHRDALIEIVENLFYLQKNPKHVVGNGPCIKLTGFWNTHAFSIRNIFNASFSIAIGSVTTFASSFTDINSTYMSKIICI